jgi:hypothetical protein
MRAQGNILRTVLDNVHGTSSFFKLVPGQFLKYYTSIPQQRGMSREKTRENKKKEKKTRLPAEIRGL